MLILQDYVFLAVGRVGSTSENITQKVVWVEEAVSFICFFTCNYLWLWILNFAQFGPGLKIILEKQFSSRKNLFFNYKKKVAPKEIFNHLWMVNFCLQAFTF